MAKTVETRGNNSPAPKGPQLQVCLCQIDLLIKSGVFKFCELSAETSVIKQYLDAAIFFFRFEYD